MISGKLAELYVDLVAKDKIAPAIAEAKSRLGNLQADLAKVGTGAWSAQIREYVSNTSKAQQAQKALAREFDVAAYGRFGVFMRDMGSAFESFKERLGAVGGIFPLAMAGMTGFVAAASPDAFTTFTMSLKYLAATVGQILLPVFIDIIIWIQRMARWIRDLDPETKKMIGTAALWAVALTGIAFAVSRLIGLLGMLSTVLRAIGLMNPFGLLLAGVGAVVADVAGVFGGGGIGAGRTGTGGGPITRIGRSIGEWLWDSGHGEASSREIAALDARGSAVSAALGGRDPTGAGRRAAMTPLGRGRGTGAAPATTMSMADIARMGEISDAARSMGISEEMIAGFRREFASTRRGSVAPEGTVAPERSILGGLARIIGAGRGGPGGDGAMLALNHQSQFLGIEQQWQRIQQAAASASPLEEEMKRIAGESLIALTTIAGDTGTIAGRPPPPPPVHAP